MSAKPVVVIGNGWAAVGAVGFLASMNQEVRWITGTGARILSPLACVEWGPGVAIWSELAAKLGVDLGEQRQGSFIREYRNKAFREPVWTKAPTPETRLEVKDEVLWGPERRFTGAIDSRFKKTIGEVEEEFRAILIEKNFPHLKKVEGVPVTGFRRNDEEIQSVLLGSGIEIECEQVIYADRWSLLPTLEGLPKPIPFLRSREPMGVLQASFSHHLSLAEGVQESFFATLNKEVGEKLDKHVWGHFSTDGKRSTWTLCLSPEEVENNHEIAKKFRRMKSTLDKIFSGSGIIPDSVSNFGATVVEEQVRFGEEAVFSEGLSPRDPFFVAKLSKIVFLTDGYGPSSAFSQVGAAFGIQTHPALEEVVQSGT